MALSPDSYFANSKVWPAEAAHLRTIMLGCGLDEGIKWGKPCYMQGGDNIAIIQEMKGFLALMFFKGALLEDADGILTLPGPNSNSGRQMRFNAINEIDDAADQIRAFVAAAIKIEQDGLKIEKSSVIELPDELKARLATDAELKAAFDALTPGRQRGYGLYIGGAKQSATRISRIEKHRDRILEGKGIHDR